MGGFAWGTLEFVFFSALVPILLVDLEVLSAGSPKLSQKSFRSGSTLRRCAAELAFSSWPSTKRLKDSAAPFAPLWIPCPAVNAALRACDAKSVAAI